MPLYQITWCGDQILLKSQQGRHNSDNITKINEMKSLISFTFELSLCVCVCKGAGNKLCLVLFQDFLSPLYYHVAFYQIESFGCLFHSSLNRQRLQMSMGFVYTRLIFIFMLDSPQSHEMISVMRKKVSGQKFPGHKVPGQKVHVDETKKNVVKDVGSV